MTIDLLLGTGISLLFLVAVFLPLEWAFPAKEGQRLPRSASKELQALVG